MKNIEIRRELDPMRLAFPTDAELDEALEEGYLAGNRKYFDLRDCSWEDVRQTLHFELEIVAAIRAAPDRVVAYDEYLEARMHSLNPAYELWDLDPGVASATIALSALGTIPVSSCNGGELGGFHVAEHPYVAMYVRSADAKRLLRLAGRAGVGLIVDEDGVARLYAKSIDDLMRFAEVAARELGGG